MGLKNGSNEYYKIHSIKIEDRNVRIEIRKHRDYSARTTPGDFDTAKKLPMEAITITGQATDEIISSCYNALKNVEGYRSLVDVLEPGQEKVVDASVDVEV